MINKNQDQKIKFSNKNLIPFKILLEQKLITIEFYDVKTKKIVKSILCETIWTPA